MEKNDIIGTGLSGLVGSRVTTLMSSKYVFTDMSRSTGVDITDKEAIMRAISKSVSPFVLHFAARTDVDGCEDEIELTERSMAWRVNVEGTRNVVTACEALGKKLLYLSTDMVFNGDIPLEQKYDEDDHPHPINWYAVTKYEGEKIVTQAKIPWVILRIAYPFRAEFEKKEYVRVFISYLQQDKEISAVNDHYFTPTFIDDLAPVIEKCLTEKMSGIYHVVGGQSVSPYNAALIIARQFQFDENLVKPISREEYFIDKALRPFNLSLKNDKIQKLGIQMLTFEEAISTIKSQSYSHL